MLVGTFCFGIFDVLKKKILRAIEPIFLLGIIWTGAGLVLALVSIVLGTPSIKAGFWGALAITFSAGLASQILVYLSFAREEASLMSPLRLITPPIVLLTGFIFLGERPSLLGVIGVLTTFFGLWQLLTGEADFRKVSFKSILANKGVLLGLAGSVIVGFSFPFDKKAVILSSSLFYSWVLFLSVGLASLLLGYFKSNLGFRNQFALLRKDNFGSIIWLVILFVLGGWLTFEALKFSSAAYAANMKRLWPLWAVILSGGFLKEKNIRRKIIAVLIMLGGIALTLLKG